MVYKNRLISISSPLWSPNLSLHFIQHSKYHIEGRYEYQFTLKNGKRIFDMPICVDCVIRKENGKFYDVGWVNQTRFDDLKTLFCESLLVPLLEPIYRQSLPYIIWGRNEKKGIQYAFFDDSHYIEKHIDSNMPIEEVRKALNPTYQYFLDYDNVKTEEY